MLKVDVIMGDAFDMVMRFIRNEPTTFANAKITKSTTYPRMATIYCQHAMLQLKLLKTPTKDTITEEIENIIVELIQKRDNATEQGHPGAATIYGSYVKKLEKWSLQLQTMQQSEANIWHAISTLADVIDHHLTSSRTSSP